MKEALSSSEMSVLTGATRHNVPEDAILQWFSKLQVSAGFFLRRNVDTVTNELSSTFKITGVLDLFIVRKLDLLGSLELFLRDPTE
jgi:hypothetical protein